MIFWSGSKVSRLVSDSKSICFVLLKSGQWPTTSDHKGASKPSFDQLLYRVKLTVRRGLNVSKRLRNHFDENWNYPVLDGTAIWRIGFLNFYISVWQDKIWIKFSTTFNMIKIRWFWPHRDNVKSFHSFSLGFQNSNFSSLHFENSIISSLNKVPTTSKVYIWRGWVAVGVS